MTQSVSSRFFHLVGHPTHRQPSFQRPTDYRAFLSALTRGLARRPVRLISYTILPDCWQLIVGPADPACVRDLARRVVGTHLGRLSCQRLHRTDTPYAAPVLVETLAGPDAIIRRCLTVERLAVRAGLATRAQDWPWCSVAERFFVLDRVPLARAAFLTSPSWLGALNGPSRAGSARRGDDFTQPPRRFAALPQAGKQLRRGVGAGHDHQADAHVERPEHLGVWYLSGTL